ncbi:hypothetical protein IQ238_22945 [Pleurocapsales cyanobacterium LEGE 06147]|nr:hypothetical protein [Pleurocapsales cyanobacterium LEGE 06147]
MIVTTKNNCQIDTNQLISQLEELEELHPLDFRLAFGLTHEEAAEELCLEPQTMRAYLKNNPSRRVKKLAATIAKNWLSEERQPVDVQYLINPRRTNAS